MEASPLLTVAPLPGIAGRAAWLRLSASCGIGRHWRVIHATTVRFRVPTDHDGPNIDASSLETRLYSSGSIVIVCGMA
jgi:hypothetical protein